ncbi:MAG TPA: hypothetical protein VJU18_19875 [Vicinamibacteria bacterium]|nr:hypothetical protein [Vicinamibacteria bacterium]
MKTSGVWRVLVAWPVPGGKADADRLAAWPHGGEMTIEGEWAAWRMRGTLTPAVLERITARLPEARRVFEPR